MIHLGSKTGLYSGFVIFFISFACVPARQFNDLKERDRKAAVEREILIEENERMSVENSEMKAKIARLEDELEKLTGEKKDIAAETSDLKEEYNRLTQKYQDLQKTQEALLRGHNRETRRLLRQLQSAQEDLQKKEDRLKDLEISISERMQDLENLQTNLEERNARLSELERILNQKDSVVQALKDKVSAALLGFEDEGLSVEIRNGKVYVSLEEKLLFGSGSTRVDPKGKSALKRLARVLEQNPDINIMIEGHTDDVPVRPSEAMQDNWDLSVKRATAVVRILLDGSSIDPKRLTASGRGEYLPVDPGKSPEARQKNRRTEIILTPKLDELFRILETN